MKQSRDKMPNILEKHFFKNRASSLFYICQSLTSGKESVKSNGGRYYENFCHRRTDRQTLRVPKGLEVGPNKKVSGAPWPQNMGWLPQIQEIGRWTPAFPPTRVPPQIKCKKREKIFGDVDRRLEDWKTARFPWNKWNLAYGILSVLVWYSKKDSECLCRWECISPENSIDSNLEPLRKV